MRRVIYLKSGGRDCTGRAYLAFLERAFAECDYFMLVYAFRRGSRYGAELRRCREALEPYLVKRRTQPSWPGTTLSRTPEVRYEVAFYRTVPEAKAILQGAAALTAWSAPRRPQDLAFFRRNRCWFFSSSARREAALLHASAEDIALLVQLGLADPADVQPEERYYDLYDEQLEVYY